MNIAIIDIGTNTFHLIIATRNGGDYQIIYKTNKPIKLGEDITVSNEIIPAAFERGIECLKEFRAIINQHDVQLVKAVATSGVRSAKNGQDFIKSAKDKASLDIEIIDGDDEAEYIYEGVKASGAITGKSLIMDIGGGSTEFILCDEENLIWKKSYNIGAARLMQRFFKSDPINEFDREEIYSHLAIELKALKIICGEFRPEKLIGSAGAFETYCQMISPEININEIKTADLPFNEYEKLADLLIHSSHQERSQMKGLIPLRVDMIVMASLLTSYVLKELHIKNIQMSTYDLKMGLLESLKL